MSEDQLPPTGDGGETPQKTVVFHYIKSNQFRVIYADGIIGSPSTDGSGIRMSFYNDRLPIPLQATHEVQPNGSIGKQITATARTGIVREVETEVIFTVDAARQFVIWLNERISEAEKMALEIARMREQSAKGLEE